MPPSDMLQNALKHYATTFASLRPDNLDVLAQLLDKEIFFADPFNQVTGRDKFIAIFEHMFVIAPDARFEILDLAYSENAGYIKWRMTGKLASRPSFILNLVGMSEVHINEKGFVTAHIDHWDSASQLLSQIPVVGRFIRYVLRLFKH